VHASLSLSLSLVSNSLFFSQLPKLYMCQFCSPSVPIVCIFTLSLRRMICTLVCLYVTTWIPLECVNACALCERTRVHTHTYAHTHTWITNIHTSAFILHCGFIGGSWMKMTVMSLETGTRLPHWAFVSRCACLGCACGVMFVWAGVNFWCKKHVALPACVCLGDPKSSYVFFVPARTREYIFVCPRCTPVLSCPSRRLATPFSRYSIYHQRQEWVQTMIPHPILWNFCFKAPECCANYNIVPQWALPSILCPSSSVSLIRKWRGKGLCAPVQIILFYKQQSTCSLSVLLTVCTTRAQPSGETFSSVCVWFTIDGDHPKVFVSSRLFRHHPSSLALVCQPFYESAVISHPAINATNKMRIDDRIRSARCSLHLLHEGKSPDSHTSAAWADTTHCISTLSTRV
jgi:hypothetical protein